MGSRGSSNPMVCLINYLVKMGAMEQVYQKLDEFNSSLKRLEAKLDTINSDLDNTISEDLLEEKIKDCLKDLPSEMGASFIGDIKEEALKQSIAEHHATVLETIIASEKRGEGRVNKAEKRIHIAFKDFHKEVIGFFQTLIEFETTQIEIPTARKQLLLEPYYLYFDEYASILGLYEDDININVQSLHYLLGRGTRNAMVHLSQLRDKIIWVLDNDEFDPKKYNREQINEILALIEKVESTIAGEDSIPNRNT